MNDVDDLVASQFRGYALQRFNVGYIDVDVGGRMSFVTEAG